jgi:transcription elongation factor GreA
MSSVPVTVEGKKRMQSDLDGMQARVPIIAKAIEDAREKGDLRENAEYHAAREEMSILNARIAELKAKLSRAVVVDESQIDTSRIAFGAKVMLEDLSDKSVEGWQLVGDGEEDALENKILTSSPMGSALLGKKVGEVITVKAPIGELKYRVKSIAY